MTSSLPLEGLRILDLTRLLPGPYATLVLADLGADVVKVEEPEIGDYCRVLPPMAGEISGLFHLLNRNKRSIALDLKRPAGRETFFKLLEHFDVVVESFRPGVMERLGLGFEELRKRQPRAILCSITGYGQDGPYRGRAGHDINYQALAGLVYADGSSSPRAPLSQVGDIGGGAWPAVAGVLAAAWERERTGRGRAIDISMTEGCLGFLSTELGRWACEAGGQSILAGAYPCYTVYRSSDGHHLALGALEPKFWQGFCQAVGKPDWVARQWDAGPFVGEVQALFSTRARAAWLEVLAPFDVCCEPVLEREELFDHPVHRERDVFFDVEGLGAKVRHARTPVRMSEAEVPKRPPPGLGQHTESVLAEAGFAAAEIQRLNHEGAIRCLTAT
jgi:crotonobetainyl-CoA:carnitine CoA-transferase CaiB-like acyl-CoA transferase